MVYSISQTADDGVVLHQIIVIDCMCPSPAAVRLFRLFVVQRARAFVHTTVRPLSKM